MTYWQDRTEVDEHGCWNWQLSIGNSGYGMCKGTTAHKRSYIEHVGPVPKGQVVRHTCENKKCCNPAHLILGTQRDNYFDMSEEKRAALHAKSGQTYSDRVKSGEIVIDPEIQRQNARGGKGCKKRRTAEHNKKISEALRRYNAR